MKSVIFRTNRSIQNGGILGVLLTLGAEGWSGKSAASPQVIYSEIP